MNWFHRKKVSSRPVRTVAELAQTDGTDWSTEEIVFVNRECDRWIARWRAQNKNESP